MQYTAEQLKERFDKLPKEVQEAISSTDIHDKIISLAGKYDLLIDQQGELVDQIGLIMLGLARSSDFVRDVSARLSISAQLARQIGDDVNAEIFGSIRAHMQEIERMQPVNDIAPVVDHSAIEQAGNFSIEPAHVMSHEEPVPIIPVEEAPKPRRINLMEEDEPEVMPTPAVTSPIATSPAPAPMKSLGTIPVDLPVETEMKAPVKTPETHTEPLVDQLLRGAMATPEAKVVRKIVEAPKSKLPMPSATSSPASSGDRYREPI